MPQSSEVLAASLAELARRLVADAARDRLALTDRWRPEWLPARGTARGEQPTAAPPAPSDGPLSASDKLPESPR